MCVILECLCCIRKDLTTVHKTDTVLSPTSFFFFALASYIMVVPVLLVDTTNTPATICTSNTPAANRNAVPDGEHCVVCSHSGGQRTS